MLTVRLAVRDGGHVADLQIPPFVTLPEVLIWGQRVFAFHAERASGEDPAIAEYREVFFYWVPITGEAN
jgi:hypothetical protein